MSIQNKFMTQNSNSGETALSRKVSLGRCLAGSTAPVPAAGSIQGRGHGQEGDSYTRAVIMTFLVLLVYIYAVQDHQWLMS